MCVCVQIKSFDTHFDRFQSQIMRTDLLFFLSCCCCSYRILEVYCWVLNRFWTSTNISRSRFAFQVSLCQITHLTSFTFRCAHLIGICIHWNTLLIRRTENAFMAKYYSWSVFSVVQLVVSFPLRSHSADSDQYGVCEWVCAVVANGKDLKCG